jgi:UDP-2,4-diacetamido-2,4,6-trideoxy-beta-L-altropyranose hydrolase
MSGLKALKTRPAVWDDADDLLAWKNDATVRQFSIVSKEPILKENHLGWLTKTLADPNVLLKIILLDGRKLGDIRFDINDHEIEVSIRLAPQYRGMGIGTRALDQECTQMEKNCDKVLTATIVNENEASLKLFTANGFKVFERRDGFMRLRRDR